MVTPYAVPTAPRLDRPRPAPMVTGHPAYDAAANATAAETADWGGVLLYLFIRQELLDGLNAELDTQLLYGTGTGGGQLTGILG